MRPALRFGRLAFVAVVACCASRHTAFAQGMPMPPFEPPTGRELFLAAAIAAAMLCSLVSFALLGRVAERTHVALAMLAMLIGGFALLVLFGGYVFQHPWAAVLMLVLLFCLFKLMSLYESGRSPLGPRSDSPKKSIPPQ